MADGDSSDMSGEGVKSVSKPKAAPKKTTLEKEMEEMISATIGSSNWVNNGSLTLHDAVRVRVASVLRKVFAFRAFARNFRIDEKLLTEALKRFRSLDPTHEGFATKAQFGKVLGMDVADGRLVELFQMCSPYALNVDLKRGSGTYDPHALVDLMKREAEKLDFRSPPPSLPSNPW